MLDPDPDSMYLDPKHWYLKAAMPSVVYLCVSLKAAFFTPVRKSSYYAFVT
jgi:hypothetical protein